ncbi:MAG: single-stranded-DNA-specific exonuclease RecJ [Candidatus Paceibacterota bacterium]|nr:single-stranded-DNA-specific exonuclease RecJ [Candidatus Paceibacterota bacterium]
MKKEIEASQELEKFPPLTRKLLVSRGIATLPEAEKFLHPDWDRDSFDPFLIFNMEKAVDRILLAIKNDEKIVLYTDYDCDGIPAGVILHDFFKKIGYKNFENYIPHRHDEGYGVNIPAVEKFAERGATLMITADLGITDTDSVARAQELGIDVIVTDHHLAQEGKVPLAYAVIDSKQAEDTYPDPMLCGAGVAFKLVQALIKRGHFPQIADGWEKWLLDMAGLSTIADMVPLKNENRLFAHYGLKVLRKSRRKGLNLLLQKNKINKEHLSEDDIGFMIAPRINAASRMDHPLRAFELLSTNDDARAEELADWLNHLNDQRKGLTASMIKDAKGRLRARELFEVIVIGHPEWEPGILGLAANNLVEEFKRPVFVWGRDTDGKIKGSCRSDGTVSLVELMGLTREGVFLQFGGHAEAGGFTVSSEEIHTLEKELSDAYRAMEKIVKAKTVAVDGELSLDDVTWDTYKEIEAFAPFGMANPKPIFSFMNAEIAAIKKFGKAKEHLELEFRNSHGGRIPAIGFFVGEKNFPEVLLGRGEKVNLIATLEKSVFRNYPELRLRIVDIL